MTMVKVLQIILNHCEVAQELLPKLIQEEAADINLLSELFRDLSDKNWVTDTTSKAPFG